MAFSGEEIMTWAGAPEVWKALADVPERVALHDAAVGLRVDMVRDALGTVLREHYEVAHDSMLLAENALSTLGVTSIESGQSPEEEPDRLLAKEDVRWVDEGNGALTSRLWTAIMGVNSDLEHASHAINAQDISAEQRRLRERKLAELKKFEGLAIGNQISLRKLKELYNAGAFIVGFGSGTQALIGKVAALSFEVEA